MLQPTVSAAAASAAMTRLWTLSLKRTHRQKDPGELATKWFDVFASGATLPQIEVTLVRAAKCGDALSTACISSFSRGWAQHSAAHAPCSTAFGTRA